MIRSSRHHRRTLARTVLPLFLVLAVLMLLVLTSSAEDTSSPHDPISITGDEEMDEFFSGGSGDGLTNRTPYVFEDVTISVGSGEDGISFFGTTRHVLIRRVHVSSEDAAHGNVSILLHEASNITIEDCTLEGAKKGIVARFTSNLTIARTSITDMTEEGILGFVVPYIVINGVGISDTGRAMFLDNAWDIDVSHLNATGNGNGLDLWRVEGGTVSRCTVSWTGDTAISVRTSKGIEIHDNDVLSNGGYGLELYFSMDLDIRDNELRENLVGISIHESSNDLVIEDNVVQFNRLGGIDVEDSGAMTISGNEVRSNWDTGIELKSSDSNLIHGNLIHSHNTGIKLRDSTGNTIVDNRIFANRWAGIAGDTSGNEVRDNDMRANSWLRALLYLIIGLVVLAIALGVYFWAKRRRRARDERGKVLVKRRFPAGLKGLWPMSRIMWDEDFFQAQLATAGPQREEILRRYQQNIAAAKQMQYMAVGTMSVFLAVQAVLPLLSLLNVVTTDVTTDNVHDVMFAASTGIAVYYLMSFLILLVFGLLFTAQLMRGELFKLLSTLPIPRDQGRRIVGYLLFRMYGAPMVVVLLAYPIGGLLLTWSPLFFIVTLAVNGLYLMFVMYALVLLADSTGRRVFSSNASKGATAMRFLIMGGYLVAMMFMFVTMSYFVGLVTDMFEAAKEVGGTGETVNMAVSMVPFPFSGSYLVSSTVVPSGTLTLGVMATTLAGLAVMAGAVYLMRRRANGILDRVARGVEPVYAGSRQVTKVEDVTVSTRSLVPAFMRNGLLVTSRDQGAILYIIMPMVFPLIAIVPMLTGVEDISMWEPIMPFVMYMGIMPFLVNMALSSGDASVGGLLGALPFKVIHQYRAKWLTIVMITLVPVLIIAFGSAPLVEESVKLLAIMSTFIPLQMVLASMYLVTFSLAFGKVNGKHTFFMARIDRKLLKYIAIIVLQYVVVIILVADFFIFTENGFVSFWGGIAALWTVNVALLLVIEVSARRLFGSPS